MSHCNNSIPEKRYRNTFFLITFLFANGFQLQDMQWNRNDKSDCRNACKSFIQSQAACNTWKCVCYSVTREIWKSHKKSGKSQEALTWLVLQNGSVYQLELPKMINELLLIKFDISLYVRYRSEKISPLGEIVNDTISLELTFHICGSLWGREWPNVFFVFFFFIAIFFKRFVFYVFLCFFCQIYQGYFCVFRKKKTQKHIGSLVQSYCSKKRQKHKNT